MQLTRGFDDATFIDDAFGPFSQTENADHITKVAIFF